MRTFGHSRKPLPGLLDHPQPDQTSTGQRAQPQHCCRSPGLASALRTLILTPPGTRQCGEPPRAREAAETKFQDLVEADIAAAGIPADQFGLFLAFAHEVINRYERFLTFLHRDDQMAKPRPYNE